MRFTRVSAIGAVSAFTLLGVCLFNAPQSVGQTGGPLTLTSQDKWDTNIRQQFGLSTNPRLVHSLSAEADTTTDLLGIPLTPAERADIMHRDALTPVLSELEPYLDHQPEFSGMWVDQQLGGALFIAATTSRLSRVVPPKIPAGYTVKYVSARYPLSQLQRVETSVTADVVHRRYGGQYITRSKVSVKSNSVELTLRSDTPPAARKQITDRYPAPFVHLNGGGPGGVLASNRNISSGPLYAGEYITVKIPLGSCTSGFSKAYSGGNPFVVTAGHCGNGSYFRGEDKTTVSIGTSHSNHFIYNGSSNCDCVAVGPIATNIATSSVLVQNNATNRYVSTATYFGNGTRVCLSGAESATQHGADINCGSIIDSGGTQAEGHNFTLVDPVFTSIKPYFGDSGGPIGNGSFQLLGILSSISYTMTGAFYESVFSKASHIGGTVGLTLLY